MIRHDAETDSVNVFVCCTYNDSAMNEYSDSFEFLQEYSAEFKERQALSRVSNSIVECRWKDKGICAQWREILGESATSWRNVSAKPGCRALETQSKLVQVHLDAGSHERAARIGNGNVSEGVRKALAQYVSND